MVVRTHPTPSAARAVCSAVTAAVLLTLPIVSQPSAAAEYVVTIRGWRTFIDRPLAGREPGWPVTVVALDQSPSRAPTRLPPRSPDGHRIEGVASFYWQDQMTANGERFIKSDFTAAHLTMPFGTRVRVTNVVNGRSVVVRINDRGPYVPGRIIDLSEAAGHAIGMVKVGVVPVRLTIVR